MIYSGRIRVGRINSDSVIIQLITYTAEVLWRPILILLNSRTRRSDEFWSAEWFNLNLNRVKLTKQDVLLTTNEQAILQNIVFLYDFQDKYGEITIRLAIFGLRYV